MNEQTLSIHFIRNNEHYSFVTEDQNCQWEIPEFNFPSDAEIDFMLNGTSHKLLLEDFKKWLEKKDGTLLDPYPFFSDIKLSSQPGWFFPEIEFFDVTDEIFFGFKPITSAYLESPGLWAFHDRRVIKAYVRDGVKLLNADGLASAKPSSAFSIIRIDNREVDIALDQKCECKPEDESSNLVIRFELDTTFLGNQMLKSAQSTRFQLQLSLVWQFKTGKISFSFPLTIVLVNPVERKNKSNSPIAIDFGTSSTCVAYRKQSRTELLSLSDDPKSDTDYENPTNLMIRDWQKFAEEWLSHREKQAPILSRKSEKTLDNYLFDQGHNLRDEMASASIALVKATIPELKLVPYKRLKLGIDLSFIPLLQKRNIISQVSLVCKVDDENEEQLDPIAVYGYLLARAVNRPARDEGIPLRYTVTVPVKFNEDVRESIRSSLEFGIRLALPRPLRNDPQFRVAIGHEEPVAFMRAVIGNPVIAKSGWTQGQPLPFGVFDFGGGTLDFAFGVYRPALESELDDHENIIEVYHTGGHEREGAEYLIHWLSYQIYRTNQEKMKEQEIPFPVPEATERINYFPEQLLVDNLTSRVNMRRLNEKFSRLLFKGEKIANLDVELSNIRGDLVDSIQLAVDQNELCGLLKNRITSLIESFKKEMLNTFAQHANEAKMYGLENWFGQPHIFRAGNASRSPIVEELLRKHFPMQAKAKKIHFIDETNTYGVRPKTAVALGQLQLQSTQDIGVVFTNRIKKGQVPFEYYLGCIDVNRNNSFQVILDRGAIDRAWKLFGRLSADGDITFFYTTVSDVKNQNDLRLQSLDYTVDSDELQLGNIVYVRPNVENNIEYVVGKRTVVPPSDTTGKIISLPQK